MVPLVNRNDKAPADQVAGASSRQPISESMPLPNIPGHGVESTKSVSPFPVLSARELPLAEAATIGGVLISELATAAKVQADYVTEDLTEPRLKVIDRVARYLVGQKVSPGVAAVSAAAIHLGEVRERDLPALNMLMLDLVDVNITPQIHTGLTMARQLVRASVRRAIATAGQRLTDAASQASTEDMATIAADQIGQLQTALRRLQGGGNA